MLSKEVRDVVRGSLRAVAPAPRDSRHTSEEPRTALVPVAASPRRRLRDAGPGELALTATLFSLYVGVRGSARLLGALEGVTRR